MKTYIPREGLLQGLDLTSEDHGLPPGRLRRAENLYLQNGKPVKRRGFARFNQYPINRTMLTQRRTVRRTHAKFNYGLVINRVLADRAYPPLGHGLIPWHSKYQPVHGSDFAWELAGFFTGQIDGSRNYFMWEQANDEDQAPGTAQWGNIRRTISFHINTTGNLVVTVSISSSATTWIADKVITSAAVLAANTRYHIGVNWNAGTGTLSLFIDGVADNTLAFALGAGDRWHGDPSRHTSYPNIVLLNRLYVLRELASDTQDDTAAGDTDSHYSQYPNTLECAAEGAGIYEIRLWNATRDFTSGTYPRNRPLTSAEYTAPECLAYWPCDDGGGLIAANKVDARRPIQLLPAPPAFVPDTGFSSGLGVQFDQGCIATQVWNPTDALVDPLGAGLARLFSRFAGNTTAATSGIPTMTVNMRIRTPQFRKTRPINAGTAGAQTDRNILMQVEMENLSAAGTYTTVWVLYLPWTEGAFNDGQLVVNDGGYASGVAAALAADTVYSLWIVRDRTGAISVYLDNATVAYSTAAILTYANNLGTGISVCIGGANGYQALRGLSSFTSRFRMEWCRVWGRELTEKERLSVYNRRLDNTERGDASLLLNLETASVTGDELPSFCSYDSNFRLGQITSSNHLGAVGSTSTLPNVEWWDSWANAVPPYWSAIRDTAWDAPAQEGAIEGIRNHRSVVKGDTQMAVAAHGALSLTSLFSATGVLAPVVPDRTSSYRQWAGWQSGDQTRLVPAADRLFLFHDEADPHVWTGSTLSPLGIDLPILRRFIRSQALPRVGVVGAAGVGGSLTADRYYSYKFVYVDRAFNVVGVMGPTPAILTNDGGGTPVNAIIIGASGVEPTSDDQRPIRAHLNPRVTEIRIYRSRGQVSAALAEAGPFLFHSSQENVDLTGIDTVADTALGPALDDLYDRPPLARFGDLFNGRLILGNFAKGQDTYLASLPGLPETFDLRGGVATEDGTGGVITGVRTAFDACWIFKSQSIWRLVDTGDAVLGSVFSTSYGCVSPGSILEFFSQAMGRRMLFFWSASGPVLFDGNQFQAIDFPLRGDPIIAPFVSMNASARRDIYTVDMKEVNQIWVFGKAFGSTDYTKLYAYDYLNNIWIEHTGLRFTAVARIDVPGDPLAGDVSGVPTLSYWFAGDHRGGLWVLDNTSADGTAFLVDADRALVTTAISNTSTTTKIVPTAAHAAWIAAPTGLRSLVATLVRANGAVEYRWILKNTNGDIDLEAAFSVAPTNADTIYIGGIQFLVEYPWDALEAVGVDKYVHYLTTWASSNLYYRTSSDWDPLAGPTTLIPSVGRKRIRTYLNRLGEVFKLEFSNLKPGDSVAIPGYAWEMSPTRSTVRAE